MKKVCNKEKVIRLYTEFECTAQDIKTFTGYTLKDILEALKDTPRRPRSLGRLA